MNINNELAEEEARIAAIYPLGGMGSPENPPEWFEDLYDDLCDADDPLFDIFPELKKLQETGVDSNEEWAYALFYKRRSGYLVRMEVCVRDYRSASSFFSGWGHVQLHWVYVEEMSELPEAVLAAARQQHEAEALKAGAK
ncbi:hypothetical protein SAMN05421890_1535 [Ensifer adhaerens]|nr:hypothetical protein SAMN05421890_1535 [Ensifer adhaerens]